MKDRRCGLLLCSHPSGLESPELSDKRRYSSHFTLKTSIGKKKCYYAVYDLTVGEYLVLVPSVARTRYWIK